MRPFKLIQLYNSSFKGTFDILCSQERLQFGFLDFKFLKEEFFKQHFGLSLYKGNFINHITIKTMTNLLEAGIPQHFQSNFYEFNFPSSHSPQHNMPQVFSLDDLWFGFIIWFYACGVCAATFAVEILSLRGLTLFKNWLINIVGKFAFLQVLKQRMGVYHG